MGSRVLGEVIAARKLLAALVALKRLLLGVERAVVALQVLLATESPVAELADKCLGRVLGEGLLAAAAGRGRAVRGVGAVRAGRGVGVRHDRRRLVRVLLGVARLGVAGGRVHHGLDAAAVLVGRRFLALVLEAVVDRGANAAGRAGQGGELEVAARVKAKVVVADEAAVAQGHDRRAGAGTWAGHDGNAALPQADQVAEAVLRVQVRQVVKDGQAVGRSRVEVERGLSQGSGHNDGRARPRLVAAKFQVGRAQRWVRRAGRDGEVPRVTKVNAVFRRNGARVGRGRRGQRRAGCGGEVACGAA